MKLFYQAIIIHLTLNLYVFWFGWKILPPKRTYKIVFASLFIFEFLVYMSGFLFLDNFPSGIITLITTIGLSWGVFVLYMFILLLVYDFMKILYRLAKKKSERIPDFRIKYIRRYYYVISILFVVIVMVFGYHKFMHPSVEETYITINKNTPHIDSIRVVMAVDFHIGYIHNKQNAQNYVTTIMEQNPDIILIPGDVIDYTLQPLLEQNIAEDLRKLHAPYGVYVSLGNHEHYADADAKILWLKNETGMTLLQDSVVKVADSFYIVGREDSKSPRKSLNELMQGIDTKLPVIVMNHEPDNLTEEVDNGADIAFYGHVHDGEVFPINYFAKLKYEMAYGYKQRGNTHLFVSSGLGIGGAQFRIGTRSEVLVVNLKFESDN